MSRIDELIEELAPQGVEFKTLGDIARLVRGNGMPKTDLTDQGVGAIHYGQIYTRYRVWTTKTISFVSPETATKLAKAEPGDIIITNTSENVEDVGKAVAWLGNEPIVTGGHATVIKHREDPKYLSYWFQSESFFVQKKALATGTKVIDVSAKQLMKVRIPVPPLEVQREIVRILDQFTQLEAELEAELEARRRQYQYYRGSLLAFGDEVERALLGDIATVGTGSHDTKDAVVDGEYVFYARGREPLRLDSFDFDESAIITAGDGVGVGKVFHFATGQYALHQRAYRIVPEESVDARYIYHYLVADFARYLERNSVHASVTSLRRPMFLKYPVPLPPLDEQRRISSDLDKFDALVNDLSVGLPAELAARRKQYEYYRDELLTFEEAAA
ncbi:restriction endonuclease subunit S [Rathayibacter sp. AY1E2]|uniref:restriction endonuclease subunit S n=1 Tax=Rathayibacter sp. AY1E2 TaxID=2080550 RepID=UPI000CE881FD|nr:restriction endonuclease subunit S [Rathayibacter sp. AY1E2]PPH54185.1 restriction endonuclease subunit S [Rathayibacter sp. AY1E2]